MWRRKQNKPSRLGRLRVGDARDKFNLHLLSKLLYAVAINAHADGRLRPCIMSQAQPYPINQDIVRRLRDIEVPTGLLVVAIWDTLKPETRTRSVHTGWDQRTQLRAINALAADRVISRAKAEGLVLSAGNAPWVQLLAAGGVGGEKPGAVQGLGRRVACPSKHFKITRRMVNYWRQFERDGIWMDVRSIVRRHQERS